MPTVFWSQCSEWFYLSSEKEHGRMIYLPWQMANDYFIFLISKTFLSWNYLVLARTQLFHQLPLSKCLVYMVSTYVTESSLVLCDSFGHFARVKFFENKTYVGFKISWWQPSMKLESLENYLAHKIFLSRKFPCLHGMLSSVSHHVLVDVVACRSHEHLPLPILVQTPSPMFGHDISPLFPQSHYHLQWDVCHHQYSL